VDVIVLINNSGGVASFEVKKSYPEGVFDDSVAAALKQWKWSAAEKNTDKVPVLTTIQFTYQTSSWTGGPKNKDEAERQCGFTNQQ
jgi:TonB family protein